ncbi:MAG: DM13 domain-containing protein [Planctomycetaceae bacterium]
MTGSSAGRRVLIAAAIVVVIGVGWYLFRPELLLVDKTVNEALPTAAAAAATGGARGPMTLASGMFHDGAHETKGAASIHQLADGQRVLRLSEFATSNGPDVHVYLVAANDAADNDTVTSAGFIDLGSLKGNVGDQNYQIPAGVDLAKHRAVTIWCARFGVNFGTAPLM